MVDWLIIVSFMILIGIGCLHVYWAFGGKWGSNSVLPKGTTRELTVYVPGKITTLFVALLLFMAAFLLIVQAGVLQFTHPNLLVKWGCWVCMIVFGVRVVGDFKYLGLFKKVRHTRFSIYDTYLFIPICAWFCFIFFMAIHLGG